MTPLEFDQLVEECMHVIPPRFRRQLQNLVFLVEQEPATPGLLGLYEGRPLTERSTVHSFSMPDRITLYQGPHEREARTPAELRRLVEETIWHEVAHYFGLDEREVLRAERVRRNRLRRLRDL
ncbi:metallopeptidase family protein [Paludibaculum fermentans]|uniref:metallopeptidase family protein n=1 Tax=Paludibaculum fermentans TaxID=1473598 RepID=UPI003EBD1E1B